MEVDIGKVLAQMVEGDHLRLTLMRNGTMMLYADAEAAAKLQSYGVQVSPLSEQTRTLNPHVIYGKFDHLVDTTVRGVQSLRAGLTSEQLNASLAGIEQMEASVMQKPSRLR